MKNSLVSALVLLVLSLLVVAGCSHNDNSQPTGATSAASQPTATPQGAIDAAQKRQQDEAQHSAQTSAPPTNR